MAGRVSNYKVNRGYVVGRLLMLGGTITGNKAAANGGSVDMDCAFEMCGGSITSNEADANGGGVAVKVIIASNGVVAVSPVTRRRTTVVVCM